MKKIHKRKVVSGCGVPTWYQPVCKVHNKTYAYTMAKNWEDVTCEVCIKQGKHKEIKLSPINKAAIKRLVAGFVSVFNDCGKDSASFFLKVELRKLGLKNDTTIHAPTDQKRL